MFPAHRLLPGEFRSKIVYIIQTADCLSALQTLPQTVDRTFLDPSFKQQKDYALHDDDMSEADYWAPAE